jgi:glycosyltransferase involved in cell wall biosynthesis
MMKQPLFDRTHTDEIRRVLYLGGFELPDKNAAAHRVLSNAKILRSLGWNVIFAGIDQGGLESGDILHTKSNVQGFFSYTTPYPKTNRQWLGYLTNATPYIQVCESVGHVAMMILYNAPSVVMAKLMRYCRAHSIICIADSTEWYSSRGRGFAYTILKSADTFVRMRILQKRMDGLIVISRYLERYYSFHQHLVIIPPLTDISEQKWNMSSRAHTTSCLKLVYAGSPEQKDRMEILIDALAKIRRPYRMDIIGMTKEEYLLRAPQHRDWIDRTPAIVFHGRCSHLDSLQFVQQADFSCFFREDDRVSRAGFPTKFAEAISCGTPVITNATSDLGEFFLDPNMGYLVENLSSDAIASVFCYGVNMQRVPRDRFDYHNYIQKMGTFLYGDAELGE